MQTKQTLERRRCIRCIVCGWLSLFIHTKPCLATVAGRCLMRDRRALRWTKRDSWKCAYNEQSVYLPVSRAQRGSLRSILVCMRWVVWRVSATILPSATLLVYHCYHHHGHSLLGCLTVLVIPGEHVVGRVEVREGERVCLFAHTYTDQWWWWWWRRCDDYSAISVSFGSDLLLFASVWCLEFKAHAVSAGWQSITIGLHRRTAKN